MLDLLEAPFGSTAQSRNRRVVRQNDAKYVFVAIVERGRSRGNGDENAVAWEKRGAEAHRNTARVFHKDCLSDGYNGTRQTCL